MGRYSGESDQWLLDEIDQYRAAIKKADLGGGIGVVAGEGRRIEITKCDVVAARATLRDLEAELSRRPGYEDRRHWAIAVEIG